MLQRWRRSIRLDRQLSAMVVVSLVHAPICGGETLSADEQVVPDHLESLLQNIATADVLLVSRRYAHAASTSFQGWVASMNGNQIHILLNDRGVLCSVSGMEGCFVATQEFVDNRKHGGRGIER